MLYGWLKEVVDQLGEKQSMAVNLFMFASHQRLIADNDKKGEFVENYLKASSILDAQLNAAKAANNEKELGALTTFKSSIDQSFVGSGAADCELLQTLYSDKVEQNKDDLEFLKETISLLRRVRCQEIEAYFAASGNATAKERLPNPRSLGKKLKKKDYELLLIS